MRSPRKRQRGAALLLAMIAITALLSLGALTVLTVQIEHQSGGSGRFEQQALYVAESGAYAGIDYLRTNCETVDLFSKYVSIDNATIQEPTGILGNKAMPMQTGNPFGSTNTALWYEVSIKNNDSDPGFHGPAPCPGSPSNPGPDCDSIVVIRSTGHGPDNAVATVEVTVQNNSCLAAFCAQEYAQRDVGERNTASVACSQRVTNSTLRSYHP
jgi:hypothetical protein